MKPSAQHVLPGELLTNLERLGEVKAFRAGDLLFREGEVSTHLYVLLAGELKVFTDHPKGRELIYNTLRPGDYFGELALDGHPRSASVRALTAAQCLVISGETLRDLAKCDPDFLLQLVVKVMGLLRRATQKLKSLALDDVYGRFRALIEEEAVQTDELLYLPQTFTQQEIANRIGCTREMVHYVIRDLVRGGYIERRPKHGLILLRELPRHW